MDTEYSNTQRNVPNQDTLEAIAETEYMIRHPDAGKTYNTFSDLLAKIRDDSFTQKRPVIFHTKNKEQS